MKALLASTFALSSLAVATQIVPDKPSADRYAKLKTDSPFAVATVKDAPEAPKESPFQNYYISSVAKQWEGGVEVPTIYLRSRNETGTFIVLTGNEEKEGFKLLKLDWADDPRKMKATLQKGGETGIVEMDQAAFAAAPMPAAGARPSIPGQPQPLQNPAGAIRPPTPTNGKGPQIPRPTSVVPPPAVPQPGNAQPAADQRVRTRVINSK
jgi:hypothetical protein